MAEIEHFSLRRNAQLVEFSICFGTWCASLIKIIDTRNSYKTVTKSGLFPLNVGDKVL